MEPICSHSRTVYGVIFKSHPPSRPHVQIQRRPRWRRRDGPIRHSKHFRFRPVSSQLSSSSVVLSMRFCERQSKGSVPYCHRWRHHHRWRMTLYDEAFHIRTETYTVCSWKYVPAPFPKRGWPTKDRIMKSRCLKICLQWHKTLRRSRPSLNFVCVFDDC